MPTRHLCAWCARALQRHAALLALEGAGQQWHTPLGSQLLRRRLHVPPARAFASLGHQHVRYARGCALARSVSTSSRVLSAGDGDPSNDKPDESNADEDVTDAQGQARAFELALLKVQLEALNYSHMGESEKAVQMLEQATEMLHKEKMLGAESMASIHLHQTCMVILLKEAAYEQLLHVAMRLLPVTRKRADKHPEALAATLLRVANAHMGEGRLEAAGEALQEANELATGLEQEQEGSVLLAELTFYSALLRLYAAETPLHVAQLEATLVAAIKQMQQPPAVMNLLPGHFPGVDMKLEYEAPHVLAASQMHLRLIMTSMSHTPPNATLVDALFAQSTMLQRAAGAPPSAMAMTTLLHSMWVYGCCREDARARALAVLSLEQLQSDEAARKADASGSQSGSEDGEEGDEAEGEDAEDDDDEDAGESFDWTEETAVRRQRLAVIDTVTAASGGSLPPGTTPDALQSTLTEVAHFFADRYPGSAITAEARLCMNLWGVMEGHILQDGAKVQRVQTSMKRNLGMMASKLTGGWEHVLVVRLRELVEERFGAVDTAEADALAAAAAQEQGQGGVMEAADAFAGFNR